MEINTYITVPTTINIENYYFEGVKAIDAAQPLQTPYLVAWLPDRPTQILVRGATQLGIIDVQTNQLTIYATVENPGNINLQPIWIEQREGIAYIADSFDTPGHNLWLGNTTGESRLLLSDVYPPLIPLPSGETFAIYSNQHQKFITISSFGEILDTITIFEKLPFTEPVSTDTQFRFAPQPNGNWLAYYNAHGFYLFNVVNGTLNSIDLGNTNGEKNWAVFASWRFDGSKLALIVTTGEFPLTFSNLYILEWPEATIYPLDNKFKGITDVTWFPDGQHILFKAFTINANGQRSNGLYTTSFSSFNEVSPFTPVGLGEIDNSIGGTLSWSPDGKQIIIRTNEDRGLLLNQINVQLQN